MDRYIICTKRTFVSKGEERKQWNEVGKLVKMPATQDRDEGYILELNMHPDTKFYVFPEKESEPEKPAPPAPSQRKR